MIKVLCLAVFLLVAQVPAQAQDSPGPPGRQLGHTALTLDGLPVLPYLVPSKQSNGPPVQNKFSYYFEDHNGNLHLIRVGGDTTPLLKHDSTFRNHPIYEKAPASPKVSLGYWKVYYYRNSGEGLIRVMIAHPALRKKILIQPQVSDQPAPAAVPPAQDSTVPAQPQPTQDNSPGQAQSGSGSPSAGAVN